MRGRTHLARAGGCAVICLGLLLLARTAHATEYVFHATPPVRGASVTVDGRAGVEIDAEGYALLDGVAPGPHAVALRAADGRTWGPREIEFDSLVNALPSFDTSTTPTIDVTVDSNVSGAAVLIDGRAVATTTADGRAVLTLPFGGSHRITVARPGFVTAEATVSPGRDRSIALNLNAAAPPAARPGKGVIIATSLLALLVLAAASVLLWVLRRQRSGAVPKRRARTQPLQRAISFDRYRLTDVIGSGGLATVYRATDAVDGTTLAVKILEQKWIDDPEMVQKFFAEAEALDAIRSTAPEAAVVRCFASGREGGRVTGQPFITMELLEGETLDEFVERGGAIPQNVAAAVGAQIAWALAGAHESGVIHRDLTPDNIFLLGESWRGCGGIAPRVVLIDFGVARVEVLSKRTLEISISGKPGYMAPEQTRGHLATPQMDLYALGVILHQMVTGRPPFVAATPDELMHMHLHAEPPELPADISDPYRLLVRALMAKDPGLRPLSAMAVAGRLESIAEGSYELAFEQTIVAHSSRGGLQ